MALVSLSEVKSYLKLDPSVTAEDNTINMFIQAAQEEMEMEHRRKFEYNQVITGNPDTIVPHVEVFNGPGDTMLFLKRYPVYKIVEVAELAPDGTPTVIDPSSYQLDPARGVLYGSWYEGVQNYRVKYEGGYTTPDRLPPSGAGYTPEPLPNYLKLECLEKVAYMYENRQGMR